MYSQAPDKSNPNEWLNLGDWVAPGKLPPADLVHTFYLWRCADITAHAAKVLGHDADAEKYGNLAEKTRFAFQQTFYDPVSGSYGPYGGNIFALRMGVPADQKGRVISALKSDILANGGHLDTGIFGTQFFFEVLSENGLHELAYEAMNKPTQPGYGWWIGQGATTTWEQWDGDGSRNHPMFGGGIVWFYRKLAGMNTDPDQPGYRHIIFRPQPASEISFASYSNLTPFGTAAIDWKKENNRFELKITVPVGSSATVYVPATDRKLVTEGGRSLQEVKDILFKGIEDGYVILKVGSGDYVFFATP
jgi:alpha-L-rhamnosidase